MKTRVISAAFLLAMVGFCMFFSPVTRVVFLCAAAMIAAKEMRDVQGVMGRRAPLLPALCYIALHGTLCMVSAPLWALVALFVAAVLVQLCICIVDARFRAAGAEGALFCMVYPTALFAVIIRLSFAENWLQFFAVGALATWLCDAFALFGGMAFGKHKLAPEVSPKKTIEGSVCGALMSLVGGFAAWALLGSDSMPALWVCMAAALLASTMGQFGDLAASLFKRQSGVKDYSNLIPGHGGMMDRADSLLFSIPTAWLCFQLAALLAA